LRSSATLPARPFGKGFGATLAARIKDADEFYERANAGRSS